MSKKNKLSIWIPVFIVLVSIVVVAISPEEKSIAAGIKPVYIHVSLTWTAMLLFFATGLLSIYNLFSNSEKVIKWLQNIFIVALAFHLAGLMMSIISSYINWGGVRIGEAQYQTVIYILIFGGIAWLLMILIKIPRISSIFGLVPTAFLIWSSSNGQIGLHPNDPVMNAPAGIKYTFLGLFLLMLMLSTWVIAFIIRKNEKDKFQT